MKVDEVLKADVNGWNFVVSVTEKSSYLCLVGASCQVGNTPGADYQGSLMGYLGDNEDEALIALMVTFLTKGSRVSRGFFVSIKKEGDSARVVLDKTFVPSIAGRIACIQDERRGVVKAPRLEAVVAGQRIVSDKSEADPKEYREAPTSIILSWMIGKATDEDVLAAASEGEAEISARKRVEELNLEINERIAEGAKLREVIANYEEAFGRANENLKDSYYEHKATLQAMSLLNQDFHGLSNDFDQAIAWIQEMPWFQFVSSQKKIVGVLDGILTINSKKTEQRQ
jgi:hypothetical protein